MAAVTSLDPDDARGSAGPDAPREVGAGPRGSGSRGLWAARVRLARLGSSVTRSTPILLRGYAQILFSRSAAVGLLLLAATAVSPRTGLTGLLAVTLAVATARLMRLSPELVGSGLYGYNALLIGLGGAAMLPPGPLTAGLLAVAVVLSVVVTAALHSALGSTFNLPALTLPFLAVFYLALGAAEGLGLAVHAGPLFTGSGDGVTVPTVLGGYLEALGAVFFTPRWEVGLAVGLALLVHSRIAVLFSLVGYGISAAVTYAVMPEVPPGLATLIGLNGVLVALALGGVWFVPGPSSALLAGAGVLASALVALGLRPLLSAADLPLLIVPFNLTVISILYAMRQRVTDGRPKAVDFAIGTPEENLSYYRTRVARFGATYAVRFRAPFLGRWVCTQGVDGPLTHRGPWRYALDFEVEGAGGRRHEASGSRLSDYHCYKLPVTASAHGTVVKVVDGVCDNPIGGQNLEQNWGNLVLVCHGPYLYSLVCHLAPGSVKVREGEVVQAGQVVGLCGNSGRSPVPHLHFQLQATARVGAPTLPVELHNVVSCPTDGAQRLHGTLVPEAGQVVRNLEPDPDLSGFFDIRLGETQLVEITRSGRPPRREGFEPDIDGLGRLMLRSSDRGTALYYECSADLFTVLDTVGSRRSGLHLVQMALNRVPLEVTEGLWWRDVLPLRALLPAPVAPLFDLVSPFLPGPGVEMIYRSVRRDRVLIVEGASVPRGRDGRPLLSTRATLAQGRGLVSLEVRQGRRQVCVVRVDESDEDGLSDANETTLEESHGRVERGTLMAA